MSAFPHCDEGDSLWGGVSPDDRSTFQRIASFLWGITDNAQTGLESLMLRNPIPALSRPDPLGTLTSSTRNRAMGKAAMGIPPNSLHSEGSLYLGTRKRP